MKSPRPTKPLRWIASSRKDYGDFPVEVQEQFGFELFLAQTGQHPPSTKPLKGLGSGVIELLEDFEGDAYRAVYTVRFATAAMCCTRSRRSPSPASRRRSRIST